MPIAEPVILQPEKVGLRHIGPKGQLWPGVSSPIASSAAVLAQTLYARPLPWLELVNSSDFVGGSYTTRLNDAGEFQVAVPNATASDGFLWRSRFDPTGHLQWVEIYYEGELDGVFCIDTVNPTDSAGYSSTADATDFCSSLWGNGAGIQSGSGGQLQDVVFDAATMLTSLFDAQAWQDFSDAAFPSLLQGLLNSALGLRLFPWQHLAVSDPSSGGIVTVHGQDGAFLLKKAYERDLTVVQSPRDVIERGTQVWVPTTVDDFPYVGSSSPSAQWTASTTNSGTVTMQPDGGVKFSNPASNSTSQIASAAISVPSTGVWRAELSAATAFISTAWGQGGSVLYQVTESSGDRYAIQGLPGNPGQAQLLVDGTTMGIAPLPSTPNLSLLLESDGEWVTAYANGALIGQARRNQTASTSLLTTFLMSSGGSLSGAASVIVTAIGVEALQPFLQRGSDKGDYVLPGTASTYPSGGLHARYSNNTDLQSDAAPLFKIHAPSRMQSYGGSVPAEYQNQQDSTINEQQNPLAGGGGAATGWWSCVWFGAVYLKLSAGNYTFTINTAGGGQFAVRVWVGKTKFGDQIIDQWAGWHNQASFSATVSAAALAGSLPYGGGSVQRDGWYPIKVEYAVGNFAGGVTSYPAPQLAFISPASYNDPGNTSIPSGGPGQVVPATSLSPLGCVDQRYQAISHFDLVQQTQQAFGYQMAVEPKQLESGLFPGVLAPRVREGQDTDAVLEPDKGARQDAILLFGPRRAFAWPLTGRLVTSRWHPGDGLRVQNQDVNIWDIQPRQILTFTRNFLPSGTASAQVSLAERPRTPARTLKQALLGLTRSQRTYQKQLTTLTGQYASMGGVALSAGGSGPSSGVALFANDVIVSAVLRILWTGDGVNKWNIWVNNVDETSVLLGAATFSDANLPMSVNLMPVAGPQQGFQGSSGLYAHIVNSDSISHGAPDIQLFVACLR